MQEVLRLRDAPDGGLVRTAMETFVSLTSPSPGRGISPGWGVKMALPKEY